MDLEFIIQELQLQIQTLKLQIQPQVDVSRIIDDHNKIVQKLMDEKKIQIDELKKENQVLKKELDEIQSKLEKKSEEVQQEHKYYLEARDEHVKLKKTMDDKISQLEQQISTQRLALSSAVQDQLTLKGEIKSKNLDIEFSNNRVVILTNQIQQLKEQLQIYYSGSQINSQNTKLHENDQDLINLQEKFNKQKEDLKQIQRYTKTNLKGQRKNNRGYMILKKEIKLNNIINQKKMAMYTCKRLKYSKDSWMSVLLLMQLDLWMYLKIKLKNQQKILQIQLNKLQIEIRIGLQFAIKIKLNYNSQKDNIINFLFQKIQNPWKLGLRKLNVKVEVILLKILEEQQNKLVNQIGQVDLKSLFQFVMLHAMVKDTMEVVQIVIQMMIFKMLLKNQFKKILFQLDSISHVKLQLCIKKLKKYMNLKKNKIYFYFKICNIWLIMNTRDPSQLVSIQDCWGFINERVIENDLYQNIIYFVQNMKSTTIVESQVIRVNQEAEQLPIRYNRKRNYMSTSFVSAQFPNNQYGCYQIMIDNHECRPKCQPPPQQPYMMPMYVPVPYPQQQEKECECEDGESYKEELLFLRQRVAELLAREPEVKTVKERVEVIDNTRVEELELEAQRLRLQLQQAQNQLRQKEQEFIELRSGNDQSQQGLQSRIKIIEEQLYYVRLEIERITALLNQKEQEIIEWERRCHEVESSVTYEIEEKTTKLRSEVEVWKSRFKKLNTEYFTCQEQLIMVQAEIDSIKNGGVKEVKEVKVEKKVVGPTITTVQSSQSRTRGSRVIESQEVIKEGTPARLYP